MLLVPGCIVREIRDNLKSANAKLDTVDAGLASTNAQLGEANQKLSGVGSGLGTTNQSLSTLEEQLRLLHSIDKSLNNLDAHLASLRRTIGKLDSAIPFLDIGGDATIETSAATQAPAPPAPVDATQVQPQATAQTAQEGAAPTRDPLLGPWVSVHPPQAWAIVLLADGRYVLDQASGREGGTWSRVGASLTFTPQAPALDAVSAPPGAQPSPTPPAAWRAEILYQTTRSVTLQDPQGGLRVLSRP
jgi:hypothetical protein